MQEYMINRNLMVEIYDEARTAIEAQIIEKTAYIKELEKELEKLEFPHCTIALEEIAKYICKKTGYKYETYGPFGDRDEYILWIVDPAFNRADSDNYIVYSLHVTPHIDSNGDPCLFYDVHNEYPRHSEEILRALDEPCYDERRLPDTCEEVFQIMKQFKDAHRA